MWRRRHHRPGPASRPRRSPRRRRPWDRPRARRAPGPWALQIGRSGEQARSAPSRTSGRGARRPRRGGTMRSSTAPPRRSADDAAADRARAARRSRGRPGLFHVIIGGATGKVYARRRIHAQLSVLNPGFRGVRGRRGRGLQVRARGHRRGRSTRRGSTPRAAVNAERPLKKDAPAADGVGTG